MARQLLDYDPTTGVSCYFDWDAQEQARVIHTQDTAAAIDRAKERANKTAITDDGIKNDMWHYAHVPVLIQMEMLSKHGVDFNDPNQRAAVFHLINTEYPHCKTTHKNHSEGGPHKQYFIAKIKDVPV